MIRRREAACIDVIKSIRHSAKTIRDMDVRAIASIV